MCILRFILLECIDYYCKDSFAGCSQCLFSASPVPAFEGTAVFGVVIEFSHAILKDVSDLTLLQERQGQLILSVHEGLAETERVVSQIHWVRCSRGEWRGVVCEITCVFSLSGSSSQLYGSGTLQP